MKKKTQSDGLPCKPCACHEYACIYNDGVNCDDPGINKGNSDARCYKWTNKELIEHLERSKERMKFKSIWR